MKKSEREARDAIRLKAQSLIDKRIAIVAELLASLEEELPKEGLPKDFGYPWSKEGWIVKLVEAVAELEGTSRSSFGFRGSNEDWILHLLEVVTKLDIEQVQCLAQLADHMAEYQPIPFDEDDDN